MSTAESEGYCDYSLGQAAALLRQLCDVQINASGTKLYGHKALLTKDLFFAAMFKVDKTEYHCNEHPDVIKKRMEKVYFGNCTDEVNLRSNANGHDKVGNAGQVTGAELERGDANSEPTLCYENSIAINEFPFNVAMELDKGLMKHFEKTPGHAHYTYALLDPIISGQFGSANSLAMQILTSFFKFTKLTRDNYYRIAIEQVNMELFKRFVSAIFFVGHGEGNQLSSQLFDVTEVYSKKTNRINRIYATGKGPVLLHCFTAINRQEARYRQSLMMQAIGVHNLTNDELECNCTDFEESESNRVILGTYLLLKSFLKFIANGQRQCKKESANKYNC